MSDPLTSLAAFADLARDRLAAHDHTVLDCDPGVRRAAVALCVVEHDGAPSVIVIKRADRGRNAGQWGLPGGKVDAGESTEQAALRELHEEIGLIAGSADVLGRLDDFPAASGFVITPLVLVPAAPGSPRPDPDEVHSVHHVGLRRLAADDAVRWVPQLDGGRLLQMTLGPRMVIHAPTGAMLWQFREVVLLGRTARVADFLQPDWTRR
jgi:8-oxo-dGTP pyrophosphatase MutT (NUDIX family)